MSLTPRIRVQLAAAALLAAAGIAGCAKDSSSPTAPPPPERQVAVTVEDSTGARIANALVAAFGMDPSNSFDILGPWTTNASGELSFTLKDGRWSVYAEDASSGPPSLVAGSTGSVGPRPAGSPDTVVYRLVVRPESIVQGKVTLSGQATHAGTLLIVEGVLAATQTAADGSYELDGVPPGTWTVTAVRIGFVPGRFTVVVSAPGSILTTGTDLTLQPTPP